MASTVGADLVVSQEDNGGLDEKSSVFSGLPCENTPSENLPPPSSVTTGPIATLHDAQNSSVIRIELNLLTKSFIFPIIIIII